MSGVHRILKEVQGQSPVEDKKLFCYFVPHYVLKRIELIYEARVTAAKYVGADYLMYHEVVF